MHVAVAGCVHGELNNVYAELNRIECAGGVKADILLCCGDFQAVRDDGDLSSLICPEKYKTAGDFPEYYSGRRKAPVLTVVIGGNHEASRHMLENYLGGWLAPNIFFLGFSGVVRFRGIRIGGLSGIFKAPSFHLPFTASPQKDPLCPHALSTAAATSPVFSYRTVYHVRAVEVAKLAAYPSPVDVMLTHDWPHGAVGGGDTTRLFRLRPDLARDAATLGNPALVRLLRAAGRMPVRWYAAHLHIGHVAEMEGRSSPPPATIPSGQSSQPSTHDDTAAATQAAAPDDAHNIDPSAPPTCRFEALSKPHPRRSDYVTLWKWDGSGRGCVAGGAEGHQDVGGGEGGGLSVDDAAGPDGLCFDAEWLAVVALSQPAALTANSAPVVPTAEVVKAGAETIRRAARGEWDALGGISKTGCGGDGGEEPGSAGLCEVTKRKWRAVGPTLRIPLWGASFWTDGSRAECCGGGEVAGSAEGAVVHPPEALESAVNEASGEAAVGGGLGGAPPAEGVQCEGLPTKRERPESTEGIEVPHRAVPFPCRPSPRLTVGQCVRVCGQACAVCAIRQLVGMASCPTLA